MKSYGWGGARPGSGRPALGPAVRVPVNVSMPPDVVEWLDGLLIRDEFGDMVQGSRSETLLRVLGIGAKQLEVTSAGKVKAPPSLL